MIDCGGPVSGGVHVSPAVSIAGLHAMAASPIGCSVAWRQLACMHVCVPMQASKTESREHTRPRGSG